MQMSRWLVLSWKYLWRSVREFSNTSIFLHVYDLSLNTHARFGYGAPDYLKEEVERIQKRALRIIHPYLSYREVMKLNGIQSLSQRRNDICMSYFKKLLHPKHKLHELPDWRENLVNYTGFVMITMSIQLTVKLIGFETHFYLQVF